MCISTLFFTGGFLTQCVTCLAQDCNLVAYSGLSATYGFNAATAVYESGTYTDSASLPCTLFVSSANGGSIYIEDSKQNIIFQVCCLISQWCLHNAADQSGPSMSPESATAFALVSAHS